jgi:glycosyltransferase involved in cell wall biosynthesis
MERLLREPQLRAQFAAAARRLVVERFSAEIVGRQIVALYRDLLDMQNSARTWTRAQDEVSQ